MSKTLKIGIGTILVFLLVVSGVGITSPQFIQGLKEKVIPQSTKEATNYGAVIIDDGFSFGGSDNSKEEPTGKKSAQVKGESTTNNDYSGSVKQDQYKTSPTQSPVQNTNYYVPVPMYQSSGDTGTTDPYEEWQIRQAEEEAKEAEQNIQARKEYGQYCNELNAQRSAALAPINAQIDAVRSEMERQKAEIDARTDLSETDKNWAKMKISTGELFDQQMDLQEQYNIVYAQYGSC